MCPFPALSVIINAVPKALEQLDYAAVHARARLRTVDRESVRGQQCHCDPSLPLHLLHSEGVRESCDFVVDYRSNVESPHRRQVPVERLAEAAHHVAAGDRVHVKADRMSAFVRCVLPHVSAPFVLVTGDSDYGPVGDHSHLLDDPRLLHWFAQNCDVPTEHSKLTRLPIGIDNPVFNRLDKRLSCAVAMLAGNGFDPTCTRNAMGDQALLQRVRREQRRRPREKPPRVLAAFMPRNVPDRVEARAQLFNHPDVHFVARRLPQEACWRAHDDHAFVLSPRGNGLDCLRTWEALFLRCIPIVKASSLDPLYRDENLPVVIVESFREITAARLRQWLDANADRFDDDLVQRLTLGHWTEKIERARMKECQGQRC